MASDPKRSETRSIGRAGLAVEMPRPTIAPMVFALGLVLLAVGVVTSPAFLVVGRPVLVSRAWALDRAAPAGPRPYS